MRPYLLLAVMGMAFTCSCQTKANTPTLTSAAFIDRESGKIKQAKAELVKLGRMDEDYGDDFLVLGQYDWHSGKGGGYFGAYSFYKPALEQAKHGWFLHTAQVLEGSNEVWTSSQTIHFDKSVLGYELPKINMSWFENGKYKSAWFTAKIIDIKDDGRTLVLDKRAPHHAEQWHVKIVPTDWVDLCRCINNFSPQFVDGHPVVEEAR